ncbi:hypothetical protein E8E13_000198 [Curvularia kusanoi]|uniref:Transmembrane protein n=1 Tax=Curvularia kusanoi TaxID=90978 RepID=A0A9P4W5Q9_CURKU|nr:hypothetical protein E8E13_000198 [Curvularia kusanoi]
MDEYSDYRTLAFMTNLAAAMLLTTVVTMGIYVTTIKHYVGRLSTNDYPVIPLDSTYWNVGCTIAGTAIGILAVVAFAMQDECLTRHELVAERGVIAIFLRPLTIKRGGDQVVRRQLPLERTLLVLLTLTAALSSASVVALFGVRSVSDVVVNPLPSYGIAPFYDWDFSNGGDGGGSFSPTLRDFLVFNFPVTAFLTSFLYKAAYIAGQKASNPDYQVGFPYVSEQSQLGSNVYETLYTGGIGLNVSSYLQYDGQTEGFSMPADYSFNKLEAIVFGTHVDVTCTNVTSEYSIKNDLARSDATKDVVKVVVAERPGDSNFKFANWFGDMSTPEIESLVVIDRNTSKPTLILALGGVLHPLILECTFAGREYLASVSVASASSPLRLDHEMVQGPELSPIMQQYLANMSETLFGHNGVGVVRGFLDGGFDGFSPDEIMISSLETVLEQLGEACFSFLRQMVEMSSKIEDYAKHFRNGSRLRLYITVVRLGGASYGWLVVPVALLLGTVVGLVRICTYRTMAEFEAQDPVRLLQLSLQNAAISDTSKLGYRDGEIREIRSSQEAEA